MPFAAAPAIDGQVGDAEWARAATFALGTNVTLRVMHDNAKLYLAVSGLAAADGFGFGCIAVADPDGIAIFHASAKLGSARYEPTTDGLYRPRAKDYQWREPDALLRDEGWTGTTVRMNAPPNQELAITFERLGLPDRARPIAFAYLVTPPGSKGLSDSRVLVWPIGLDDGVATVELIAGFNPYDLRFDPARWMIVKPTSSPASASVSASAARGSDGA